MSETHGSAAPRLGASLWLLASVWLLLACGGLVRPWLGASGAAALTFAAATALVLAARIPRGIARPTPDRFAAAVLGFAAGAWSLGIWIDVLTPLGRGLGLAARSATPPLGPAPLAWLCTAALAPLFEELLYRERLIQALRPRVGGAAAVVASALLFALPHLEPWKILAAFCCGLLLGALYCATGSLLPCIGYHAGVNLAAGIQGVPPLEALLSPGAGARLQILLLCAAFWLALWGFCAREGDGSLRARAALGWVLGAFLAHLGRALLYLDPDLLAGASVGFVPFGVLAAAPGRRDPRRTRFLAAGFAALLPAQALARVGCLARGCCYAPAGTLAEIAGVCALYAVVRRQPPARVAPLALISLGLLRLALAPLRVPALPPLVPGAIVALALVAAGIAVTRRLAPPAGANLALRDPDWLP